MFVNNNNVFTGNWNTIYWQSKAVEWTITFERLPHFIDLIIAVQDVSDTLYCYFVIMYEVF